MGIWHISCMTDFSRLLVYKAPSFHYNCIVQFRLIKCINLRVAVIRVHSVLVVNQLSIPIRNKDLGLQSQRKCDLHHHLFQLFSFLLEECCTWGPIFFLAFHCWFSPGAPASVHKLGTPTKTLPPQLKLPRNPTALQV